MTSNSSLSAPASALSASVLAALILLAASSGVAGGLLSRISLAILRISASDAFLPSVLKDLFLLIAICSAFLLSAISSSNSLIAESRLDIAISFSSSDRPELPISFLLLISSFLLLIAISVYSITSARAVASCSWFRSSMLSLNSASLLFSLFASIAFLSSSIGARRCLRIGNTSSPLSSGEKYDSSSLSKISASEIALASAALSPIASSMKLSASSMSSPNMIPSSRSANSSAVASRAYTSVIPLDFETFG